MERRHVILISGKDSLATAIIQIQREPSLPYELIHNDTGWDLPETLEWIDTVGEHLNRKIVRVGDDLTEICMEEKCLPLPVRRFCTRLAKIKPLNDYLGKSEATVYYGLRADEPDRVGYSPPEHQIACYPLRECGFQLRDVWKLCESINLLPPKFHWQWMEERVRELLAGNQQRLDNLPPWERASLLALRSRSNCDRCFYARLYEKVGLLEHYPDRFENACLLEEKLCHGEEFSWSPGYRLRDLANRAEEIKEKRAKAIVRYLASKQVRYLWDDYEVSDDLSATSCGLLCGK